MIFYPQPLPEAERALLARRFPSAASVFIRASDGTRLHAWYLEPAPRAALVLYFGGNAEEVSWMISQAALHAPGTGWLLVDYRGYGSSEGKPGEAALTADAIAWYDYATQRLDAQKIVAFGRSLGSAVAVQLAASRTLAGVILVAPFDSLTNVARHHYPYLPVGWLLKHPFDSARRAPGISAPLLCLVAEHDEVIPPARSKGLFDAWKGPKRWVQLRAAGHNSTDEAPAFWAAIGEFLVKPD